MKQTREWAPWRPRPHRRRSSSLRGAAHLDSNEDTGFSTELLRSQGFRPASVKSGQDEEP
ncbi:hypothetical protein D623_10025335 [Myotis brandtii]|uniref:Uncharacterized protein n=1 Tax=Myotis brandtii TaxID=109478 RepID=S7NCX0_MYOBR|nr:hypothetical protein D623_10025335 [Myotis brandtii]